MGTARAPTKVLCLSVSPNSTSNVPTTRLPRSTHTSQGKCARGEGARLFLILRPCLSNVHQRSKSRTNTATHGGYYAGPARTERRGSSVLHEPHRSSSTSTGREHVPCACGLQTNKRTGQLDYQYQTFSPSAGTTRRVARSARSSCLSRHVPEPAVCVLEHERTVVILGGGYEPRSWVTSRGSFSEGTRCFPSRPGFLSKTEQKVFATLCLLCAMDTNRKRPATPIRTMLTF